MELNPRYDGEPIIELVDVEDDVREAAVRQRRRSVETLGSLDEDQWHTPSRCEGWTVKDVAGHLASTNGFWVASIRGGLAGEPTRYLADFDPKATPAAIAAGAAAEPAEKIFADLEASNEKVCGVIEALSDDEMTVLAEAPPGHVAIEAVVHHAIWDSWIHERDMLLPLGIDVPVVDDEVRSTLRYALALSPAFAVWQHPGSTGVVGALATDPSVEVTIRLHDDRVTVAAGPPPADALTLSGSAAELAEFLSVRVPYEGEIAEDRAWMLSGLAAAFS